MEQNDSEKGFHASLELIYNIQRAKLNSQRKFAKNIVKSYIYMR